MKVKVIIVAALLLIGHVAYADADDRQRKAKERACEAEVSTADHYMQARRMGRSFDEVMDYIWERDWSMESKRSDKRMATRVYRYRIGEPTSEIIDEFKAKIYRECLFR